MNTTTANPATATSTGLKTKALIVNVNISTWSGRKHDKKATREVEEAHNAQTGEAGRFNKMLTNKEFLAEVITESGAARQYLYENTLPWGDNGDRLLTSAIYFDFVQKFNIYIDKFNTSVDKAADKFNEMKQEAKVRLNGLYNESDYPTLEEFKSKFSLHITFMPIPEVEDFRLDLNQTEVNSLRKTIENEMTNRIEASMSNIWDRIKEQLNHMKERLTATGKAKDGSDKPATFRDSLFNNLSDLITLIPKLNITDSPEINAIVEELKTLMIDPEKVRESVTIRSRKADEVNDILNKFSDFFGS